MKISKIAEQYPILREVIEKVREVDNIFNLYPPQKEAINLGVLDGENLVLSVPTASGKTLVAELAMMKTVLKGKKSIYVVPLRALASEKYFDLKEKYSKIAKIGISTGDYDSRGTSLGQFDIIIVTIEKMDSLMRHSPEWLEDIKLVVLDEVHLLDSVKRGPTLEVVITKLKYLNPQFLALSATIQNSEELANWLNAKLVESNFRPVKLSKGVYVDGEVSFDSKPDLKLANITLSPSIALALDTIQKGAQSLVFVNTRRSAEKEAEILSEQVYSLLSTKEKKELNKIADKILNVLERPTSQCKRLSKCVRSGTAFHHAGLHSKQRELIETNFKKNLIKAICATPTLAAGVNLPGKRVVIRDYKRYGSYGMEPVPILEIHQMFGRAGRPKYDSEGEAILIARNMNEFEDLWSHYIEGEPEPISSKLGVEPILRTHVLGLIAENPLNKEQLLKFFEKTFYAYQYGNLEKISAILDRILDNLFSWKFIDYDKSGTFHTTKLGLRVAQLYLDPLTAHNLIEILSKKLPDEIILLTVISDTIEMRPLLRIRSSEEIEIYDQFQKYNLEDEQVNAFKNALVFYEWMNESTDDKIFDKYNMPPGNLRTKLEIADWLLYSSAEIAKIIGRQKMIPKINILRKRLKYGVKQELLPLVRIRDIGRVRARKLFNAGIRNVEDIQNASLEKLEKIVGKKITRKILENVNKNL